MRWEFKDFVKQVRTPRMYVVRQQPLDKEIHDLLEMFLKLVACVLWKIKHNGFPNS